MNRYDAIVIGAGNSGLVAALDLVKKGKKVLVLESNSTPGGFATSFVRGRFEFEASLQALSEVGIEENPGRIYKLFERLGVLEKIDFVNVNSTHHIYSMDLEKDYQMPFGVDLYISKMEEYVPGSRKAMEEFFSLAREVREALLYVDLHKGRLDKTVLESDYPNFMKVSAYNVESILRVLKMPKRAQEILTSYWLFMGSPSKTLSFVHFASQFYVFISQGISIPRKRSYEISASLAEEITRSGGEIKYLSTVQEILIENEKISGVKLTNGEGYYANHIISSASPDFVFGKMLPSTIVPENACKLTNSRVLGGRGFSIYIGLNHSAKELGLEDYMYFIYHSLDSNHEYLNMCHLDNDSSIVTVINNALPSASFKGTTILNITSMFFSDVFSKMAMEENYFQLKEKVADQIITAFEKATGILIKPYIEEIEIATPVTFARYSNHPDGVINGYKATGYDNILPRLMNMNNEKFIPNLRFCGGFSSQLSGYSSTYLSGELAASLTLKDMREEE